jgi:ribosomal-protein-alanine N-acetyltransferase
MSAVMRPVIRFEAMSDADLAEVVAIEQSIYAFPWTIGNFRDSVRAGYSCQVLRVDGHMAGYAVLLVGAGEAHLLNLSVAVPYQRNGHGSLMLRQLIQLARGYGCELLFLEVRPSNEAGRRLYAHYGFTQAGVRRKYYPAAEGREDALVLSLPL